MTTNKSSGFTLIEAMIVVAIIAILIAVAYPAYFDTIRKSRRSDGMDALLYVQQLQEKYRANNTSYGTIAQIGYPGAVDNDGTSSENHYNLQTSANTATTFTVAATGQGSQASDTGNPVDCTVLTLTVTAANPRGVRTPAACWSN